MPSFSCLCSWRAVGQDFFFVVVLIDLEGCFSWGCTLGEGVGWCSLQKPRCYRALLALGVGTSICVFPAYSAPPPLAFSQFLSKNLNLMWLCAWLISALGGRKSHLSLSVGRWHLCLVLKLNKTIFCLGSLECPVGLQVDCYFRSVSCTLAQRELWLVWCSLLLHGQC